MGVHTWNHYVNYEIQCFENFDKLLNDFCIGCHTPDDMGGCHKCEVGKVLDLFVEYIKNCYIDGKDRGMILTPNEFVSKGKISLSNKRVVLAIRKAIKDSYNLKAEPFYKWLRCNEDSKFSKLAYKEIKLYRDNWKKFSEKSRRKK